MDLNWPPNNPWFWTEEYPKLQLCLNSHPQKSNNRCFVLFLEIFRTFWQYMLSMHLFKKWMLVINLICSFFEKMIFLVNVARRCFHRFIFFSEWFNSWYTVNILYIWIYLRMLEDVHNVKSQNYKLFSLKEKRVRFLQLFFFLQVQCWYHDVICKRDYKPSMNICKKWKVITSLILTHCGMKQ